MKYYYDDDADLNLLKDKTAAIIGYGNQGRAQALNLRDSGIDVVVGLRKGSSNIIHAENDGLRVNTIENAAAEGDIIVILIPDEQMPELFETSIKSHLSPGNIIGFAHGFSILYDGIKPPPDVDVILNSPKCIGYYVRENYQKGFGFPNLAAVYQDASGRAFEYALAYAKAIGGTRTGVMESTFEEETVTNLFAEQSVLCGGISELIKAAFDTLVNAGYSPEIAYLECLHEIMPIIDLFYRNGLAEMNRRISNTAEFGEYVSGPRVIGAKTRESMKEVLENIRSGNFAQRWMNEHKTGNKEFEQLRRKSAEHPIEVIGRKMREKMPWLKKDGG